ncbi:MAG: hypothetical protein ABFR97_11300 [Thermodesulfobacteriota bacterium]
MKKLVSLIHRVHGRLLGNNEGATMIEYALVVAAVVAVATTFFMTSDGSDGTLTAAIRTKLDGVVTGLGSN